ncbi:hypothetical protein SFUMM280S_09322 [Streptomyces fumanus]
MTSASPPHLETRAGDLNDSVKDIRDALPGSAGEEYERSVAKITGGGRRDGRSPPSVTSPCRSATDSASTHR